MKRLELILEQVDLLTSTNELYEIMNFADKKIDEIITRTVKKHLKTDVLDAINAIKSVRNNETMKPPKLNHITREEIIADNTKHLVCVGDESKVDQEDEYLLSALDNNARQFGEWLHRNCFPVEKGRWQFTKLDEAGKDVVISRGSAYEYYVRSLYKNEK
jgi:hypothetical protein